MNNLESTDPLVLEWDSTIEDAVSVAMWDQNRLRKTGQNKEITGQSFWLFVKSGFFLLLATFVISLVLTTSIVSATYATLAVGGLYCALVFFFRSPLVRSESRTEQSIRKYMQSEAADPPTGLWTLTIDRNAGFVTWLWTDRRQTVMWPIDGISRIADYRGQLLLLRNERVLGSIPVRVFEDDSQRALVENSLLPHPPIQPIM